MSANRAAATAAFILGAYLQVVERINLFPWNDVRNGSGQDALNLYLGIATAVLCLWLWIGGRVAALVTAAGLLVWAYLQIITWWIPYFTGASDGWRRVWKRWFSETIHVLPRTADHLPPDANHLVLHGLIGIALLLAVRAALTPSRR